MLGTSEQELIQNQTVEPWQLNRFPVYFLPYFLYGCLFPRLLVGTFLAFLILYAPSAVTNGLRNMRRFERAKSTKTKFVFFPRLLYLTFEKQLVHFPFLFGEFTVFLSPFQVHCFSCLLLDLLCLAHICSAAKEGIRLSAIRESLKLAEVVTRSWVALLSLSTLMWIFMLK